VDSPASYRISVPGSTQEPNRRSTIFAYGTVTLFGRLSHTFLLIIDFVTPYGRALQPHPASWMVWADPRSLATTRGIISFPLGTKMFQFPRLPSPGLCVQPGDAVGLPQQVSLFGYPRINACTRLPEAFRSVPRPSSALDAKASTVSS
jgi:hypothetical protein